jgi:poly-gamma-glutamate synthesis protein (capsule biosynthesis protein)
MTGVTALTRVMITKLNAVGDPLYFSELIGDFLSDADITHVSNEVSFKEGCSVNYSIFCSPPEMIEVLKASGVDLVELTGNHNNDVGSQYNIDTINLYRSLGWNVVGGGRNTEDAAKPYIADQKGSKLAFLAYNYPDSPNGNPIAGPTTAGANGFDFDRIKTDIESAKLQASNVIVSVQFWECYAYPDGYIEFPECYNPIPNQKEVFRELIDLGADMVVGSSAHQPQTYEIYNDKPIYYGLGNLYFDQTQWPGTERGLVLTNYYTSGQLLQTKISPTVFDTALQTRLMTNTEAEDLLQKLNTARSISGL